VAELVRVKDVPTVINNKVIILHKIIIEQDKVVQMEASGDLGGTFGAEIEANKLKYALANAQTNEEAAAIRATMEKMGYSNVSQYDPFTSEGESNPNYNPNLGYDPTGVIFWQVTIFILWITE
jgi:hypothetical protein